MIFDTNSSYNRIAKCMSAIVDLVCYIKRVGFESGLGTFVPCSALYLFPSLLHLSLFYKDKQVLSSKKVN